MKYWKETAAIGGLLLISAFAGLVIYFYFDNFDGDFSKSNADWGTFGDYIGGVLNPALGFLSFSALLATLLLQSKELKEAREQFSRSASAQEASEKVLNRQAETLIKQQFESTFFSLLELHNKALESISTVTPGSEASPIGLTYDYVFDWEKTSLQDAKHSMEQYSHECGHYFRALYQVLKFLCIYIPGSKIDQEFSTDSLQNNDLIDGEKMYANIIRSYLRSDILQLLAVNCFCENMQDQYYRYKLLIERYSLLEHMPFDVQGAQDTILVESSEFYESTAFGNSDFLRAVRTARA